MKIKQITESAGGTTSGAIATVASPIGTPQKRAGSLFKGKKTKKKFYEGKMKDLAYDIQHLDAGNFMKKYGHPKDYFTKKLGKPPVSEAELSEQDLIVVPGMRKSKDTSFIPHEKDRRDHEVEMARSEVYAAAKDAMRIFQLLKDRTEDQGIMGWQQSYITLASDYLNSVADSLEYQGVKGEGGMSNFEEGRYYNPLDQERREQDAMDQERRDFKRREMEYELRNETNNYAVAINGRVWKVFTDRQQAENIARSLRNKGKKAEVHVTGASPNTSESKLDEKKDACYNKVKSRYKVWPSAYASGALVKCRKVGASNWGNKSKK